MYEATIPARPEMVETIQAWARNLALAAHLDLADAVQQVAAALTEDAVRRNQPTATVTVQMTLWETGLRLEVRDPGENDQVESEGVAVVSRLARAFGTSKNRTGHLAWAEIGREPNTP
ncbi:hypothetical protein [Streptosporangium sp. NPDC000239]|uniref:ATP-binding protein n=1 Tax=Streptosporangium jomthongense TaxID=1193683 RepID=A0ABV8EYZ9_9ACTN